MTWTTGLAIYFLIFCFTAFVSLPFGIKTAEEAEIEMVPGQAESAPHHFDIGRHLLRALAIAVVLTALAVAVVAVLLKAQMITLAAMTAVAWMVTETSASAWAATYRAAVVFVDAWVLGSWWWTGRVGADPAESTAGLLARRLRAWLPGVK